MYPILVIVTLVGLFLGIEALDPKDSTVTVVESPTVQSRAGYSATTSSSGGLETEWDRADPDPRIDPRGTSLPYYQIKVTNTHPAKIYEFTWLNDHFQVKDEHGNSYKRYASGLEGVRLRPGESRTIKIYVAERPVKAATTLTLTTGWGWQGNLKYDPQRGWLNSKQQKLLEELLEDVSEYEARHAAD